MKNKELSDKQQRVLNTIEYLKDYINTYKNQTGYLDYNDETIIDDIIYGLGVALDDKQYRFLRGFVKFKERIVKKYEKDKWEEL